MEKIFVFLSAIIFIGGSTKTNNTTGDYLTVPTGGGPVAVSNLDRVYTADQSSNTVSVIDPSTDQLLGIIRFENPRPQDFSPLYDKEANVHGMGISPDQHT